MNKESKVKHKGALLYIYIYQPGFNIKWLKGSVVDKLMKRFHRVTLINCTEIFTSYSYRKKNGQGLSIDISSNYVDL